MPLTLQSLLFVGYGVFAIALAVTSVVVAITNRHETRHGHAALAVGTGVLVVPVFGACALGSLPGWGFLLPLSPLLPVLCAASFVLGVASMRGKRASTKLLTVTVSAWNLVLAAVYLLRCLQVLFHLDPGPLGSGALAAFALAQHNVGSEAAETLPIFLYLPILLPICAAPGSLPLTCAGAGGFLATFMLCLLGATGPGSFALVQSKRTAGALGSLAPRSDIRLSMRIGHPRWRSPRDLPAVVQVVGNTPDWPSRIARARRLRLDMLELPVGADVVQDPERFQLLENVTRQVRIEGLELCLIVETPRVPGKRLRHSEFQEVMQQAHWVLAERLEPDLLVLFSRPFHRETQQVVGELPMARWAELIRSSVRALKQGHPKQRTAVDLEPPLSEAKELFVQISEPGKGPDEIRFVLEGNRADGPTTARTGIELGGWIASHPTHTRISLVASPPTPLSQGGHAAQAAYLHRLIDFAAHQPLVGGLCLGPMFDGHHGLNGYWDSRDRPRPSVLLLQELMDDLRAGARSPPGR